MDQWLKKIMFALLLVILVVAFYEGYFLLAKINWLRIPMVGFIRTFFNWAFGLYLIMVGVVIFLENKNPAKTLSWLLILSLLPVVGFGFYILFGRNYRYKFRSRKKGTLSRSKLDQVASLQKEMIDYIDLFGNNESYVNNRLINLLLKNSNAPFSVNNWVEILTNGEATYSSMIDAMMEAKSHIHFEFFIIRDDDIGNQIKNVLMTKAKEGVKVRVIYDSVGCWRLGKRFINELKSAGCEVLPFFPVVFPILSRELNYRNHRKIIVVDGRVGFLGGLNIGDEYLGKNKSLGFWRDTHIKVLGEAVYSLQDIFLNDWHFLTKQVLEEEEMFPKLGACGESTMQIAASGPDSDWKPILQAYFTMISTAEDRIWITTPYLVPEESIKMGLITAALSGVDVKIIIPSKPDHFFVYWASQDNIQELLEAGVKVYRYKKGFIHSKIVMVDGIGATVGTANLDIRSLEINFEVNAFVYDREVVKRLEQDFIQDMNDSDMVVLETFINRPKWQKILEAAGRLVSPIQ